MIFGINNTALTQNQFKADSLKLLLARNDTLSIFSKLDIYKNLSIYSTSPVEVLLYSDTLLQIALKHGQYAYVIKSYQYKGVAYRLMGNLKMSLKSLFHSAEMASKHAEYSLLTNAYLDIANTYTNNNDLKNAIFYNKYAIKIIRLHGSKQQLAINLLNTGYCYYTLNKLDSALSHYNEAEPIFDTLNIPIGKAYTIGNRALVYWKKGNFQDAEESLKKALELLAPLGDQFGMADYYHKLGCIYSEQGKVKPALQHANKALEIGKMLNMKEQIRDASLLLSQLYKLEKDFKNAFAFQTQYINYKDSIENNETTKQLANLRTEFEINLKEKEIALLEKKQLLNKIYMIITIFLLVFSVLLLLYFRQRFLNTRLMAFNEQNLHDENIRNLLTTQETKTLKSMVQGQEMERKRLAQELHNHFGSLLATIKVNLNGIDVQAISNHHTLTTLVDKACSDIRNLSHTLNMGISDDFGLVPSLKELTAHLQQANGIQVEFSASMNQQQMGAENEICIYRIIQELVSNVLKHAEATKLSILLTFFDEENLLNILVQDNGKGFDAEKAMAVSSGMGLKSLKEMVNNMSGDIQFDSNPVSGTTVNIDLYFTPLSLD